MAWLQVPAHRVQVGDRIRTDSGEFWRVVQVMEPSEDWPRGYEVARWWDIDETAVFNIDRPANVAHPQPPAPGVEVEF